jgi:hypothetical protein
MKKLVVLTVMVLAGVAFASSLNVPWFIDTWGTNVGTGHANYQSLGYPPMSTPATGLAIMGLVYLHNNKSEPVTCAIEYYTRDGEKLEIEGNNTFSIAANATIAFRPSAVNDTWSPSTPGGQEAETGAAVPDRPKQALSEDPMSNMWLNCNGAIVVRWVGVPTDVQGNYRELTCVDGGGTSRLLAFATLLPAGAGG